jgi:molybdopterin synthase catalytic subunit
VATNAARPARLAQRVLPWQNLKLKLVTCCPAMTDPYPLFSLNHTPIQPELLRTRMLSVHCGAFVSFEGWVRDHHFGRAVSHLHYQAHPVLATERGLAVVSQAHALFPVHGACCVHRIGPLSLTDIAVWVGVSSAHRDAAFAACRYIIDEIKAQVPIWKHEHYTQAPELEASATLARWL